MGKRVGSGPLLHAYSVNVAYLYYRHQSEDDTGSAFPQSTCSCNCQPGLPAMTSANTANYTNITQWFLL